MGARCLEAELGTRDPLETEMLRHAVLSAARMASSTSNEDRIKSGGASLTGHNDDMCCEALNVLPVGICRRGCCFAKTVQQLCLEGPLLRLTPSHG